MVVSPARSHPADPLATYRSKRDFSRTREPRGAERAEDDDAGRRRFVVQRHRARRLHYDFRLEIDGVLASWAVPKGPTLDPAVRRAAFHVEDHPLEYFDFEGVIPAGEYGGGDVIVWDLGSWEPYPADSVDPASAIAKGELHCDLHGEKLRGRFVLVRTKPDASGSERWLLLHKHDEFASPGWDAEEHPRSVLSGRTNDEVKADPDRLWDSNLPPAQASVSLKPEPVAAASDDELSALDALGSAGTWSIFGRDLRVTNLDKVLFPARPGEDPVTKRDLLRYSAQIAPVALPYLRSRPLNMQRFPNGAGAKGFWHKELPKHAPEWLPRWDNPNAKPGDVTTYLVVDEPRPWSGLPTLGRSSGTLGRPGSTIRDSRPTPSWTSTPGRPRAGTICSSWPGCTAPPSTISGSSDGPRSPAGGASRSGCRSPAARPTTTPGRGSSVSPGRSAPSCPSWSAGSGS